MHYDYLIVGAGLYGAVFAYEMKKRRKRCLVIDKRDHLAGNIFTKKISGIDVHWYGAHIFHTSNEKVWRYVNQFAHFNHYINSPIAIYKDELYNLPFNMNTFHAIWGVRTPQEAQTKIAKQIEELGIDSPKNLEEQALCLVGRDIYEKLVKGYTEKQWGRECKDLPAFIIKRLPCRFTYDNNYFNDIYQGIPEEGYTHIVEQLLTDIPVYLNTEYHRFLAENKGKSEPDTFGKTLYTGMIDDYYEYRLGNLEYRSLCFEVQELPECDNYQGNAVVNYTDIQVPYTRIIEHKHFVFGKGKGTVITKEYSAEWKKGELPYYPVNDEKNMRLYEKYKNCAKKDKDIIFGGRLGHYKYYDMDKVVEAALEEVQKQE